MTAGDEQDGVVVGEMTVTGMSLEALDAVAWERLETADPDYPMEDVPRMLRRLALAGAGATEEDSTPLFECLTAWNGETSSAAAAALPFVVALAADPAMGSRVTLVELLVAMNGSDAADEDWAGARSLLADADPVVRQAAIPLAGSIARLLERWRVETAAAVRLPVLLALGEAAVAPETDQGAVEAVRAVLAQVLAGEDPVLWVAAVYASAGLDRELAVRHLDRLVEVFADLAVRPRFEETWYQTESGLSCNREDVLWWISRRLEHDLEANLSFVVRLTEAAGRSRDTLLRRAALDLAWHLFTRRRAAAPVVLPLAGALLDDPDGAVRLRAANLLAALGPVSAPYADRLAELLDDDGADEYFDGTVGEIARWALTRIGDPRALPGLIRQLRAQEEQDRSYCHDDPRRPDTKDVLIPLRTHADVLLSAMREAIRDGGARGGATHAFLAVLEAWGEDALPALPDLLPLLAVTGASVSVLGVLRAMGPAAASAEPAVRAWEVLDSPGSFPWVAMTAACIGEDREAALRLVGDAVMTSEAPGYWPIGALAGFGLGAAPYADRVRFILENSTQGRRLTAATTLWSITGRTQPTVQVLEEFVLPIADGDDSFGSFRDALQGLIRIGAISPAIRDALLAVRESQHRLSQLDGYEAILQDEELRRLTDQALACAQVTPGATC
ncbi:hypothetical protein [Kitasatospora herbaricolor]|uniref:hypothetical protein n=1 Tax=Kitasatospora herbaricolor TaxID=68217 RepID=UPI0036D7EE37